MSHLIYLFRYSHATRKLLTETMNADRLDNWLKCNVTGEPNFIDHIPSIKDLNNDICIIRGDIVFPKKVETWVM